MSMGSRIKERRESLGLSREDLGAIIGVGATAVGNYETGVSTPKFSVLYKLFDALKCDANYLYQDDMSDSAETTVTNEELDMLRDYRRLDYYGKKAVRSVLSIEVERVEAMENEELKKLHEELDRHYQGEKKEDMSVS